MNERTDKTWQKDSRKHNAFADAIVWRMHKKRKTKLAPCGTDGRLSRMTSAVSKSCDTKTRTNIKKMRPDKNFDIVP